MIIPEYYSDFIARREIYGYIASLHDNQYCDVTRTCGIFPIDDQHLKVLYMSELSPRLLDNLRSNPRIALNGISAYTFESYQLKGTYILHSRLTANDMLLKEKYLKGMLELIDEMKFGISKTSLNAYCQLSATALIMKVDEIYEQTPKQGTGEKIEVQTAE